MKPYYQNELTTIYNGDCLEIMDKLEKVSLVITSPPYNIIRPNSTDRGYDLYNDGMSNKDYSKWITNVFNNYNEILAENGAILFNMSYGTENTEGMFITLNDIILNTNFTVADIIVWKKQTATPNNVSHNKLTRIVEYIFVLCRKTEFMTFKMNKKVLSKRETGQKIYENIFNFIPSKNNDGSVDLNKATFSKDLVHKLLKLYYVKGIVLDNFSGTGTTSYACEQLSIKNIAIELSKKQCDYTIKRLNNLQMKMDI